MQTLRTPDKRFADIPNFPYTAHFCELDDDEGGHLRVAWVDEGPEHAEPVLLLHGEPTWSFLYRKMNPDRFARSVVANTGLPTGDFNMPEVWWQFRRAIQEAGEELADHIVRFPQQSAG